VFLILQSNAQNKVVSKPIDFKIVEAIDKYTKEFLYYFVNKSFKFLVLSKKKGTK
jgi:hypothetical protein